MDRVNKVLREEIDIYKSFPTKDNNRAVECIETALFYYNIFVKMYTESSPKDKDKIHTFISNTLNKNKAYKDKYCDNVSIQRVLVKRLRGIEDGFSSL